jgi:hypothetical protein
LFFPSILFALTPLGSSHAPGPTKTFLPQQTLFIHPFLPEGEGEEERVGGIYWGGNSVFIVLGEREDEGVNT